MIPALLLALGASGPIVLKEVPGALPFEQRSGEPAKTLLLETMGGGLACGDLDGDGDVDLLLTGGGVRGDGPAPADAVFWNRGERRFERGAALPGPGGWSMGACLADYDGDGDLDAYITRFGPNLLLRNDGGGRFTDVTASAGADDPRWSMGAAWADYDRDGDLDLFVANYVDVKAALDPKPTNPAAARWRGLEVAVGPAGLPGAGDALMRNEGDGTFARVEAAAGVADPKGAYGFQPIFADLTGDGLPDIFVADDTTPNLFYRNRGDGTFSEEGVRAGLAYSLDGQAQAGMGVCLGDPDGDGDLDLLVTNFSNDYNAFYRNLGGGFFEDATAAVGLRNTTWSYLSWGCSFTDFDRDGRQDLFIANGHIYPQVDEAEFNTSYRQPDQVFRNTGDRFVEADAGLGLRALSRGACVADLDGDGREDVVVGVLDGKPTIIWNESPAEVPVLRVRLRGTRSPRDGVGAVLRVAGGPARAILAGESFLGSRPYEAIVPLPGRKEGETVGVEVAWPSGLRETFRAAAGASVLLREGEGKSAAAR